MWIVGAVAYGSSSARTTMAPQLPSSMVLTPRATLRNFIHGVPYWPHERYSELASKYWSQTRAWLVATELAREIEPITVPTK